MEQRIIEKNDVDISQLFRWKKKVEIEDRLAGEKTTVYLRLLGDADIGRARAHAYRKAGETRKLLKTADSGERLSLLAEINDFKDKESFITAIAILRMGDYYQKAMKQLDFKEPKEPSTDDTQETWEKYQEAVDDYPKQFSEKISEIVVEMQNSDKKVLEKLEMGDLYRVYENEAINRLAQEKMNESFFDMCLFFATYKDEQCKIPAFNSFEDAENAHPSIKSILVENYRRLELGTDTLKSSPGVTGSP